MSTSCEVRKYALLVNPAAGGGRAGRRYGRAARALEGNGHSVSVRLSTGPGHLTALARAAAEAGEKIVVCGGDGSINEAFNGLAPGGGPALGIIPCGRGDDIARNLGLPRRLGEACRVIQRGRRRSIDLVRAGNRLFAAIGGAGIDAEVTKRANESRLPLRGYAVYSWAVLRALASFRPYRFTIRADRWHYEGEIMFAGVANMPIYGGGMRLSPRSVPDDGTIEICIIESMSRLKLLANFPRLFRGTHLELPGVRLLSAKKLSLSSDRPAEFYADGERIQKLPLDIAVLPRALDVIVP